MLSAFALVLRDLWYFIIGRERGDLAVIGVQSSSSDHEPERLPAAPMKVLLEPKPVTPLLPSEPVLPSLRGTKESDAPVNDMPALPGATLYVVAPEGTPLLAMPYEQFDGVLARLSFGQAVTLRAYDGRYAQVLSRGLVGYIAKSALGVDVHLVAPELKVGSIYGPTDTNTGAIRRLIHDEFSAGALALPLQAGEYILYRLGRDQVSISWPAVRPRVSGQWHTILRGVHGIHTGVVAKTDTIMEWHAEDGDGRLAYVEAVLPDQTLRLSGVGIAVAGEYSVLTVPVGVWREWRPVFITITM